jgi:hypothetical protein
MKDFSGMVAMKNKERRLGQPSNDDGWEAVIP